VKDGSLDDDRKVFLGGALVSTMTFYTLSMRYSNYSLS
jgi:hypothetical protein